MAALVRKLDRLAELLLDTGKRNNLINFRQIKGSTAEVVYPACADVFSQCAVGHVFRVVDAGLDADARDAAPVGGPARRAEDAEAAETGETAEVPEAVADVAAPNGDDKPAETADTPQPSSARDEYVRRHAPHVNPSRELLVYAPGPRATDAVRSVGKKARQLEDETGINVSYLAFGLLRWTERGDESTLLRAPLLLVRVSVNSGSIVDVPRIEVADDDVVVNPTFNHLLEADYGIRLPAHEDGEGLDAYLGRVAELVAPLGWEVEDACWLGVFSFLKVMMYEDLKSNADMVLSNPNVVALLGESVGAGGTGVGGTGTTPVENPLVDLHTVVDADASQIEAIEMAKSGTSFVLQGPPGTGKSQTITNIIAELIHDGKRVLFVSEKQAALNVVHDKLRKVGLADFCLELHSHKANKRAVIDELMRTLEAPRSGVSERAGDEIRRKVDAQAQLDAYVDALHKRREPMGHSLFELFELHAAERESPEVRFAVDMVHARGRDWLLACEQLLERYVDFVPTIGPDYRTGTWYGMVEADVSLEGRAALSADLETLRAGYAGLVEATARIREVLGKDAFSLEDARRWQALADLAGGGCLTPALLDTARLAEALGGIHRMGELGERIVSERTAIRATYDERTIRELDGEDMLDRLTGRFSSFFSRLLSQEYKEIARQVQAHRTHGGGSGKASYDEAVALAAGLRQLQADERDFAELERAYADCLPASHRGPDSDWEALASTLEDLQGLLEDGARSGCLNERTAEVLSADRATLRGEAAALGRHLGAVEGACTRVQRLFDPTHLNLAGDDLTRCLARVEACQADLAHLANWRAFTRVEQGMEEAGITGFLHAAIDAGVAPEDLRGALRRGVLRQWIDEVVFSEDVLATFSRVTQDQAVREFCRSDALHYEICRAEIASELSMRRPSLKMVAAGSAVATLRREGQKRRKQMPIRRLFQETGELIQQIKPCLLMSPLSVSTFLDPHALSFDTVVFDEASQIFPQDAIGAIYRAEQLIVVGDSRQMPPSDFFSSVVEVQDDEDASDVGDFESILDVASAVFPTKRLSWHYRSHHEELIAFSNLHFYDNSLMTFPSAQRDRVGIGVDYHRVRGTFDRRTGTNRAEADHVADLVFDHFRTYPERSLGVVAFSLHQQALIERVIARRRMEDPTLEALFSHATPEPFFVKNLETVQGDERDTIIFSVAYAPDAQGRFLHNFGPLNREGGERRLNVAVTRAKDCVMLVASISAADIDLTRTQSEGVRLLRAYLDYAEHGPVALGRAATTTATGPGAVAQASPGAVGRALEDEVGSFLAGEGFVVDSQVGCSEQRVDLGVRLPEGERYLLAVECDGETYRSLGNARDRDALRRRVLENMGWSYARVWSCDWYRNGEVERERLLEAARAAVERAREEAAREAQGAPEAQDALDARDAQTAIKAITAIMDMGARGSTPDVDATLEAPGTPEVTEPRGMDEGTGAGGFVVEAPGWQAPLSEYVEVDALGAIERHGGSLQEGLIEVLESEAPLSEEWLVRRIVTHFGRKTVTKVVARQFDDQMAGCERRGIVRRDGFIYLAGTDHVDLRVPGVRREVRHISIEELASGLYLIIQQNVTVSRDGLFRTLAELIGYTRAGDAMSERFAEALRPLVAAGLVEEDGDTLTLA